MRETFTRSVYTRRVPHDARLSRMNGVEKASGAALAVASAAILRGRWELSRPKVERVEVELPGLGLAFDGYRVAQFSDVHLDGAMTLRRLRRVVQMVNEEEPDLVAFTGDFVSSRLPSNEKGLAEAFRSLRSSDGTAAVLGNHDHLVDAPEVRRIARSAGVKELCNDVVTLRRGADSLHVAGVDDLLEGKARIDRVLERLPGDGAAVLLAHCPDFADVSGPTGRFGLQLSGHSHGGQALLPLIGPVVKPPYSKRYPVGSYEIGGMRLYTNRGLGTVHVPLRLNCRPEVTVFTLRSPRA